MLTPEAMLNLAAGLTDAAADGDAETLTAIAWRLYGEAGENLAEISRLRAAIHAAWTRPQETASPTSAAPERVMLPVEAKPAEAANRHSGRHVSRGVLSPRSRMYPG